MLASFVAKNRATEMLPSPSDSSFWRRYVFYLTPESFFISAP